MTEQFKYGRFKYISFIANDMICLSFSVLIASVIYGKIGRENIDIAHYWHIVIYMLGIDVLVTFAFNTLNRVLRRRKRRELLECIKHVVISILLLTFVLFTTKQGTSFSRIIVYLAYAIYLFTIICTHIAWKAILQKTKKEKSTSSVLLITTNGYMEEGFDAVTQYGMTVKGVLATDKTNEGFIHSVPLMVSQKDAIAFLCWERIDRVLICGPDSIDVPEALMRACRQMGIPSVIASGRSSFDYETVKIKTVLSKEDNQTGLSFFEGEHDIPFQIKRLYTIFESEQDNQKGFHPHKKSWHLLFCPYGSLEVMIDTGKEKKTISLSDPSRGLILHPSVWREIIWKRPGSVLCVAASGHYDSEKLNNDYSQYTRFLRERKWSTTLESAEILGENIT